MSEVQFTRAWRRPQGASIAPLLIGSALLLIALTGRSRIGAWLRGFFDGLDVAHRHRLRARLSAGVAPRRLRQWILGRPKALVAAEFGPPRAAALASRLPAAQTAFWRGDTWYYAIDPHVRRAMAVRFENDRACEVEFVDAPEAGRKREDMKHET